MLVQVNGQSFDYDQLINIAQRIDRINYMDLVHDHILTGEPMKSLKYNYKTVVEQDFTFLDGTAKTCQKCNEILPIAAFRISNYKGKTYAKNTCKKCAYEMNRKVLSEKYGSPKKYYQMRYSTFEARQLLNKKARQRYYESMKNPEFVIEKRERAKKNRLSSPEKYKEYKKKYTEKNREIINERARLRYWENREKENQRSRLYRERKKQLKKLQNETTG